jgi:hypothetical protein
VFDIFTVLLGGGAVCALARVLLNPPRVWDEDDCALEEIEAPVNYSELRKQKPHIWMD